MINNMASVSSVSPLPSPSRNHNDIDADDPATWPPYMRCMHEDSLAEGGKGLARRQVEAEAAFWRNADADGWQLFTADDDREH